MAELISADQLEAGDVFFDPETVTALRPERAWNVSTGLRKVDSARMFCGTAGYRVVNYTDICNGLTGEASYVDSYKVVRVEKLNSDEALLKVSALRNGERLLVFRADGWWWG